MIIDLKDLDVTEKDGLCLETDHFIFVDNVEDLVVKKMEFDTRNCPKVLRNFFYAPWYNAYKSIMYYTNLVAANPTNLTSDLFANYYDMACIIAYAFDSVNYERSHNTNDDNIPDTSVIKSINEHFLDIYKFAYTPDNMEVLKRALKKSSPSVKDPISSLLIDECCDMIKYCSSKCMESTIGFKIDTDED